MTRAEPPALICRWQFDIGPWSLDVACWSFSLPQAPITQKERAAIEAVIKKEMSEKILAITRASSDTVEVRTGIVTSG